MKKLIYFGIAFGLLLFGLVVLWGAFVLHQRLSLKDDMTFYSAKLHGDISLETEQGVQKFQVIEVICKARYPFNTFFTLNFYFYEEDEKESDSLFFQTKTTFPEYPAKSLNGIWITRLYVLGAKDGSIGVFDTVPTQEAIQKNPKILESLVPYDPPQENIRWTVGYLSNTDNLTGYLGTGGGAGIVHGFEGTRDEANNPVVKQRIGLYVGYRPLDDTGE